MLRLTNRLQIQPALTWLVELYTYPLAVSKIRLATKEYSPHTTRRLDPLPNGRLELLGFLLRLQLFLSTCKMRACRRLEVTQLGKTMQNASAATKYNQWETLKAPFRWSWRYLEFRKLADLQIGFR